jgi:phospholipid/cholesterol/gamma-HCH transport system substrate-binding protein
MRRLILTIALALAASVLVVLGVGASGGEEGGYKVRAIFDYVRLVPGEDVKVAGAKVGTVEKLDVTPENKAAVTMKIEKAGFSPFHSDAHCTIRPQSLIGETFVECDTGSPQAAPLAKIREGDGKGEHLLPLESTSSPVDLDLINNIMRVPQRQRLALILTELGAGVAGRGKELNEVIHRANPAFRETDHVLAILARQSDDLRDLVADSDRVLEPLARERTRVSDFVVKANQTAQATAERRADISRTIERLPRFLPELRRTMSELGALSDEMTPVLADLRDAAPDLSRFVLELGPFSRASIPALEALGDAADVGRPALQRTEPLLVDLQRFGEDARPVSLNLDQLTRSLDKTGGIERIMDYLFFQMTAINGFDGVSHYLRAALIVNLCSSYATAPAPGCNANFTTTRARSASSARLRPEQAALRRALRGDRPVPGGRKPAEPRRRPPRGAEDPRVRALREQGIERIRRGAKRGAAPDGADGPLLDYLLGSGP